jgi:hypothetical protein
MKPAIMIFMTEGLIESVPSLRELVSFLAENGHRVNLVCPADNRFHRLSITDPNVELTPIPLRRGRGKLDRLRSLTGWIGDACKVKTAPGTVFIGVDAEGLMMARIAAGRCRGRLVYYSLEILCLSDCRSLGNRLIKTIERRCHRRAEFTVIQDPHRGALLAEENQLSGRPTIYVPNSSGGPPSTIKSDYLRQRLALTPATRIALHAGTIADWSDSERLARTVSSWPDDWVLVFQCRQRPDDEYGKRVLALADQRRVWVLTQPLDAPELRQLVASADVGIALYAPLPGHHIGGKNVAVMGKSSGKIATYLQQGLPVIATDHPSLDYIRRHNAGRMIARADQVAQVLPEVVADYSGFSRRAIECYLGEFALATPFETILKTLEADLPQHRQPEAI